MEAGSHTAARPKAPSEPRESTDRWESVRQRIHALLCSRVFNVLGGALLVAMHAGKLASRVADQRIGFAHAGVFLNFAVIAFYALVRRPPERITLNPGVWLLSVVSTWWGVLFTVYIDKGARPILPDSALIALTVVGLVTVIWARASLGRSFGLAPARRGLVRRWAYRYVRHPIYSAVTLTMLPVVFARFSVLSLALCVAGVGLMVARAYVEEAFLKQDADYREYAGQVRYMFIPYVW